jgi:murein DD-endopeptidase MepM/ murein hydrolase activator NlpD
MDVTASLLRQASSRKVFIVKSFKKFISLIIIIAIIAGGVLYFRDTAPPLIELTPGSGSVSAKTKLLLSVDDEGTGLKNVKVNAIQGNNIKPLLTRDFPEQTATVDLEINLAGLQFDEGNIQIEVTTVDQAVYHFGKGNVSTSTYDLVFDSRAPIISVLSKAHNFTRGGSGLVTFKVNEEVSSVGVQFGDHFFPAFQQESGAYACLLTYPYNVPEKEFIPRIVARDLAGNERQTGIYYRANYKSFRDRSINISDNFLQTKMPEFEGQIPDTETPLEAFLYINREIRKQNRAKMAELSQQTSPVPLWEGTFIRQPKAATLALFADHRTYYYNGKKIDTTYHLGYDLASVAQAEIQACNSGTVIWADNLGIYGQCIVIDHGLGLQTLYAHMSQLDVQQGDKIVKGQIIGHSGATGLAGGDHLHLGVFVNGIAVQPIEWWDKNWLHNNVDSKLDAL